jgi:hypothetical protein
MSAGSTGTINTIAIGHHAGRVAQGANSIAIGFRAAPDGTLAASSANTISIGATSGSLLDQDSTFAIAVGSCAGQAGRTGGIAIGTLANNTGPPSGDSSYSVVMGYLAGFAGVQEQAIVIGANAASGQYAGQSSVIIGPGAGTTLAGAVVIGKAASCGTGLTNGVVINGSNGSLGATGTTGGFWVKPVRSIPNGATGMIAEGFTGPVYYNQTTGEFAVSLA